MERKSDLIIILVILIVASFFRLWKLSKIPPGLYPDVAINGNEAFFSLKNRDFKVFYPENYGREGLMIWLIALSFSIFGVSIFSIKIVAAIIGILTVFGTFLFTKELFQFSEKRSRKIAFFSSFFLAISFWHVNFSRIGFRAILVPFVLTFSLYFLLRSFKRKSIFDSAISGIFFGLGFYTYTSFRMAVLILPILFFCFFVLAKKENWEKKFFLLILIFLIVTFFVALPIGVYFLKNPEHFSSRASPVMIFSAEDPLKEFLKSLILHLGMFNFYGDPNWRHNMAKSPQLIFPVGILFLIGVCLAIKESFKFRSNLQSSINNLQLLIWFFVMLLPGVLTREGIPHSLRVVGTIPPTFIFAGIGANFLWEKIEKSKKYSLFLKNIGILFLILIAVLEGYRYFFVWARKPEVKSEFTSELLEMGNYLNSLPEDLEKYVIVNRGGVFVSWAKNLPMPAQTIMFLEISKYGKVRSEYLLPEDIEKIKIEKKGVVLPMSFDEKIFEKLKEKFPEGKMKKVNDFFVYEVEK